MHMALEQQHQDQKQHKKLFKSLRAAAYSFGTGLGLMVVPIWFSSDNENSAAVDAFNNIGYWLICFSAALILTFIFARKQTPALHSIIIFFGYPTILAIFGMDMYDIVTNPLETSAEMTQESVETVTE